MGISYTHVSIRKSKLAGYMHNFFFAEDRKNKPSANKPFFMMASFF